MLTRVQSYDYWARYFYRTSDNSEFESKLTFSSFPPFLVRSPFSITLGNLASNKGSTLLVVENTTSTTGSVQSIDALEDPERAEAGEDQADNRDETRSVRSALVSVDTKERPGDSDRTGKVTFRRGVSVGGGSGLENEEREEDEDLGPDTGWVGVCVAAKGFEASQEDEDGGPTVVEREGKMDEDCEEADLELIINN